MSHTVASVVLPTLSRPSIGNKFGRSAVCVRGTARRHAQGLIRAARSPCPAAENRAVWRGSSTSFNPRSKSRSDFR
eukprot:6096596-Pyramimonas_sp.AAC.1